LWLNRGNGTFEDGALLAGVALPVTAKAEASMGVDAGDVDNDGDEDLLVTELGGEGSNLFVNDGSGLFEDKSAPSGVGPASLPLTGFGAAWVDVDQDGLLDVLSVNGTVQVIENLRQAGDRFPLHQRKQLLRNLGNGRFEDVTSRAGSAFATSEVGRGAAFGDIDNDGDVDVVINDSIGPPELLKNQGEGNGSWVLVRLAGAGENRDAIGARVTISAGGRRQWRERRSASSYLSADDPRIHFGLGSAERLERLEVRWPDGTVEAHEGLPARRLLEIRQGEKDWKAVALSAAAVNAGRQ
jgi:hypothetical protein